MAIVTQTDKRSGITYAYDTTYRWDKEKKQSRAKRVCVGKVDPQTGKIVPTRGRAKKRESNILEPLPVKRGPKPFVATRHLYYGVTYMTVPAFPAIPIPYCKLSGEEIRKMINFPRLISCLYLAKSLVFR